MKIPRSLGRYEVVDLIGQGGMGALYRARDPLIGRYVAIKLLRRDLDSPELRDRFSREARAAGGLSHPNIVTIYDVGEDDGLPFIAMEFVQGETFADLVCLRPPLPLRRKLQLMEEVCAGLTHAHEAGIVHRDIKPTNLIVGSEGIVKILDFGIAKLLASGMTIQGAIVGTLNYMSPEQIEGTAIDPRTDIFAIGAVLYELVSHQQAFPGQVAYEVLNQILSGVPTPITTYCPDLDPRLVRLIDRALEKDPDRRFPDVATLQKELTNIRLSLVTMEGRSSGPRSGEIPEASDVAGENPPTAPRRKTPIPVDTELRRLREQHIEGHLNAAAQAFEAGRYDAAIESAKQVLMLVPSEERAIAQLDRIQAAIDERRQQADAAEQQQRQAEEAARRQEQERIESAVAEARRRFAAGDHQAALQSLEALPADNETVAQAGEQLRLAFTEIEARRRLNEEVERALGDFEVQLADNALAAAEATLQAVASLAPRDLRLKAARRRFEQVAAARAAAEAAEARRRDGEQKLAEAAAHLDAGNLADASSLLKLASDLVPQHPRAAELNERLRLAVERKAAEEAAERLRQQVATLLERASTRHQSAGEQSGELTAALRDVNEARALDPANTDAASLKSAIEESIAALREATRVRTAINNARARFANGKHQAALRLLEEFEPSSQPVIAAALSELRAEFARLEEERKAELERIARQEKVAALLTDARTALDQQQFDPALEILSRAGEIDASAPEIAVLTDRVRQAQEAARLNAEIEKQIADLDGRLSSGDLSGAGEALIAAEALDAADTRVRQARERVDEAIAARAAAEARRRDLEEKHETAEGLLNRGDLQQAAEVLAQAAELDVQHPRTVALKQRLDEAIKEREAAEAAERRQRTIDELLAKAEEHLRTADSHSHSPVTAMQAVNEVLALAPGHAGALALKTRAEDAIAVQRKAALTRATVRNARTRFANGKYRAAIQLLESLDASTDPSVASALAELRSALREIEERKAAAAREAIGDDAQTRVILVPREFSEEVRAAPPTRNDPQPPPETASAMIRVTRDLQRLWSEAPAWNRRAIIAVLALILALLVALLVRR